MLTTVQTVEFVYVRNFFKWFILLTPVCSQASSQSLKPYYLGVLFLNEVMCMDKANGLLFDLHCCKDMLLVSLSWSDGRSLWFCCVLPPFCEVRSYVYFLILSLSCTFGKNSFIKFALVHSFHWFCHFVFFLFYCTYQNPFSDLVVGDRSIPVLFCCFR